MKNLQDIPSSSEITPESLYRRRREFLRDAVLFTATATGVGTGLVWLMQGNRASQPKSSSTSTSALPVASASAYSTTEPLTPYQAITTYNNFYEFGLDKRDPAANARTLRPRPWTLRVEGEVSNPLEFDLDQLRQWFPLEERIYRMRCVEAWSMVIPWLGFPLGASNSRLRGKRLRRDQAETTASVRSRPQEPLSLVERASARLKRNNRPSFAWQRTSLDAGSLMERLGEHERLSVAADSILLYGLASASSR